MAILGLPTMTEPMQTLGSLCSGIGGLDIAVEQHFGAQLSWHSDIDPRSEAVMGHHWPDSKAIGDFTQVDPTSLQCDVLCCGFPCQPVSVAGLKAGTADKRWLFDDIVAFINQLSQLPKVMVFENVQGFLSNDGGKTARRVVGQIVSLGYRLDWGLVRASGAQLPHQRSRWFGLATLTDSDHTGWSEQRRPLTVEKEQPPAQRSSGASWGNYTTAIETWEEVFRPAPHPLIDGLLSPQFVEWMLGYPDDWTSAVPSRSHRLKLLGNSVSPPQARLALDLLSTQYKTDLAA